MLPRQTCPICGTEFQPEDHRRKFCSRACFLESRRRASRNRVTLLCEHCGQPYEQKPSRAATSRFCSKACKAAHRTTTGRITCTCKVCGKQFERLASRQGDYCSYACMGMDDRDRVTLTCEVCGAVYEVQARHAKHSHYCSLECKHEGWSKTVRSYIGKRGPTTIELLIRQALDSLHIPYTPETPVGKYVVDFLLPAHAVALEVDGDYWHSLPDSVLRDQRKDAFLRQHGYTVVRIAEGEINQAPSVTDLLLNRLRGQVSL